MRTTLDLPEELVEQARAAVGFKSKTDTVVFALREVVRRQRIDDLKNLMGRIRFLGRMGSCCSNRLRLHLSGGSCVAAYLSELTRKPDRLQMPSSMAISTTASFRFIARMAVLRSTWRNTRVARPRSKGL